MTPRTATRISFHDDPVDIAGICTDLRFHGAVYWHRRGPTFQEVADAMKAQGVQIMSLCAMTGGAFLNFIVRADLARDFRTVEAQVADAIVRWQGYGEPVPHLESL